MVIPRGGSLSVSSPDTGIITRIRVKEGQQVTIGQALFELSTERQSTNGELTALIARQLASRTQSLHAERRLRITQHQERKAAIVQRLESLEAEGHQLSQEIALAKRRHDLAQQSLATYQSLQSSGFVSAAQTQEKQENLIDLSARLTALIRTNVQLQSNRQQLKADLQALATSLATDLAQLERSEAMVQQEIAENSNRKSLVVTAPQDGTVTTITYQPGQAVSIGQTLATLIPSNMTSERLGPELEVHLYAPSRKSGFVAPGQTVMMRYEAFPYQKFGLHRGVVMDVSRTPFAPSDLPPNLASTILSNAQQNTPGFNEALYRIRVRPERQEIIAYGLKHSLKPGMTLEAEVIQDNRKIWEWVAAPLLAITR